MTFAELIKSIEPAKISITIDKVLPKNWRLGLSKACLLVGVASFVASLFGTDPLFDGVALLFAGLFIISVSFEAFYNSSHFAETNAEYAVALALYNTEDGNVTRAFLESMPGRILFFRLGIPALELGSFVNSLQNRVIEESLGLPADFVTFGDLAISIYQAEPALASFLSTHSINAAEFAGAANWIGHELAQEMKKERWWGREQLLSVSSIGVSLDYGMAYELSKYGVPIDSGESLSLIDLEDGYRRKEISALENILSRAEEANALIIDNDESVSRTILLRLLKKVRTGKVSSVLRHKSIIELDWNSLAADKKQKGELEMEILKLLKGARDAGNIIIYIPNLPAFMTNVKALGVSLSSLLEEFLRSRDLQIIGHATKTDFHYFIETNSALIRMFERLIPEEEGLEASMPAVLEKARQVEGLNSGKIFFSYPGILAITESADRYITYGEMPSKALDLLVEITPWAIKKGVKVLQKNDVLTFVSEKTGVQSGEISKEEGDKLSHLEEILHKRIVGQKEAVSAIGSALRRARSGISNPNRPFASFLFLGPTGVGKTETSKTLAENFFGGEEKIIRFDMSEFNGAAALPALIGSYSENRSGALASKIRDNPYGVLLLDEFEKASPDVRDLFLQILDEGEFTDAIGNKVNCKNLIIIATSNAGSPLIWKMVEAREDLNVNKQKIIDSLISERIYKPELINRFDGVVIFHPLQTKELESVASMMFAKLAERIKKEKDIKLEMSPSLLDYLVQNAGGQEFGARAINRLMQEKIEDFVAKKIISKEASPGSTIVIKQEDLE